MSVLSKLSPNQRRDRYRARHAQLAADEPGDLDEPARDTEPAEDTDSAGKTGPIEVGDTADTAWDATSGAPADMVEPAPAESVGAEPSCAEPVGDAATADTTELAVFVDTTEFVGDRAIGEPERIAEDATQPQSVELPADEAMPGWEAEEWVEPEDSPSIVRPYAWTRGRTRPVQDLALEMLVSTSKEGRNVAELHSAEHTAIAALCADVRSVAEVAALLALPLGVARVLLADMIDTGLVYAHYNPMEPGSLPGLALMERVLAGLNQL
ncbi:MAG TPA: DUF742 domain-containing protein [Pseudonocardiaceae bacterium]